MTSNEKLYKQLLADSIFEVTWTVGKDYVHENWRFTNNANVLGMYSYDGAADIKTKKVPKEES